MASSTASTVEALEQVPLLAELTKRDRQRLARSLIERTFAPGKQIVIEGRGGVGFFLIVEGKAIVSVGDRVVRASAQATTSARWRCWTATSARRPSPPTQSCTASA